MGKKKAKDSGEEVTGLKTWNVAVPITGVVYVTVEAADEESAIEAALDKAGDNEIEEWEAHRRIVGGNVFYGTLNEAEAEEQ